jgi:hypothetical protein
VTRNRLARLAATLSLVLTGVLVIRIIAIGKPAVFVILLPALAGAVLAARASGRAALVASAALTAATASVLLIGGVGYAYLFCAALFVCATVSSREGRDRVQG